MGWNGSGGGSTPVKPKVTAKKPSPVRGIVAGVIVCAVAIGAYFTFPLDSEKSQVEKSAKESKRIKEVTPAPAPKAVKDAEEQPKHKIEIRKLSDGRLMKYFDGKKAWAYPRQDEAKYGVVTSSMSRASKQMEERIFDCPTDVHLAYLANYEPGEPFGEGLNTHNFTQKFLKSLETPIIVTKDDTPTEAALKRSVNELRLELKTRYDAGEDIEKVVNDTIKSFQDMGAYKAEVDKEIDKLSRDPEVSQKELDQFVDAANKMLEAKGLKPASITGGALMRLVIRKRKRMIQEGVPLRELNTK